MIEILIYVILASVLFYWIGYYSNKPKQENQLYLGEPITDIKQIIHFYTGQFAIIVSEPTNPNYKYWQDSVKYNTGEVYRIRGVGVTSCWLEKGGGTFPVPHQHLKLVLKSFYSKTPLTADQFRKEIEHGFDVFNVIGKFAIE